MRTETVTRELYKFEELEDDAKQKAIEWYATDYPDYEWWDFTFEDAKTIGLEITSFDNYKTEGKFTEYVETVVLLIIENHGETCETYTDAVKFCADLKALDAEYTQEQKDGENDYDYAVEELEGEFLKTILEDYRIMLNKEYEYVTSEEAITENIIANECEFTKEGKIA